MTRWLLAHGATLEAINEEGETALHAAARDGDLRGRHAWSPRHGDWRSFRTLKLLLDEGADVDAEDGCGVTPLLACCGVTRSTDGDWTDQLYHGAHRSLNSRFAKTQLLLERGASANAEARSGPAAGCTPLGTAT